MLKLIPILLILVITSCGDNANVGINPNQPNLKPSSPLVMPAKIIAENDAYNVGHNTLSNLNVLSNDIFNVLNGTVSIVSGSNGTCTWNSTTNLIDFLPTLGFTGNANCVYQICQGSTCDTATVSIAVKPFSFAPGNHSNGCGNIKNLYSATTSLPSKYNSIGSGTAVDPFIIYTGDQLSDLAESLTSGIYTIHLSIRSDIDFDQFYAAGGKQFSIPNNGTNISNIFLFVSGNNCILSHFKDDGNIATQTQSKTGIQRNYAGLFGFVSTAEIRDLRMINTTIKNREVVGSIVGIAKGQLKIINSSSSNFQILSDSNDVYQNINYTTKPSYLYNVHGGLAGLVLEELDIQKSFACGKINSLSSYSGGLVGRQDGVGNNDNLIQNSYFKGNVFSSDNKITNNIGGIVGFAEQLNVDSSYSAGYIGSLNPAKLYGISGLDSAVTTSNKGVSSSFSTSLINPNSLNIVASAPILSPNNTTSSNNFHWESMCLAPMRCMTNTGDNPISAINYFYSLANFPMSSWSSSIWTNVASTLPTIAPGGNFCEHFDSSTAL